jgi:hypothetical protein
MTLKKKMRNEPSTNRRIDKALAESSRLLAAGFLVFEVSFQYLLHGSSDVKLVGFSFAL